MMWIPFYVYWFIKERGNTMNSNMRKMYTEEQIAEIIQKAIETGIIKENYLINGWFEENGLMYTIIPSLQSRTSNRVYEGKAISENGVPVDFMIEFGNDPQQPEEFTINGDDKILDGGWIYVQGIFTLEKIEEVEI